MTAEPRHADLGHTDLGRVHFVGIGGAGMSGIARVLLARGARVSGSDARSSRTTAALTALGATVHLGHAAAHVDDADTVVVSTAIRQDNPELVAARERGLRVLLRAEALATLMAGRRGVAVAGTHGKTTTTSMLTVAVQHCGVDPSFAIGGDLNEAASNAHHGSGELFVVEADESDGSFLAYRPHAAIVTNVEADHLDHYGDAAAVDRAFEQFVLTVDPRGFVVMCADDEGTRRLAAWAREQGRRRPHLRHRRRRRPAPVGADRQRHHEPLRARPAGPAAAAGDPRRPRPPPRAQLRRRAAARHRPRPRRRPRSSRGSAASRACAAAWSSRAPRRGCGSTTTTPTTRPSSPPSSPPPARWPDAAGSSSPSSPTATAARSPSPRSSGARSGLADEVVVMEVYSAGEDPVPGATGATVAAAVPLPRERVRFEPSWSAVPKLLADRAEPGDLVLTLGAGDITAIGPEVLRVLSGAPE